MYVHVHTLYLHVTMFFLFLAGKESPKPLRFLERVEKAIPRPPTPIISAPEPGSEEVELAVVLLQRVIRGRAIQNKVLVCACIIIHVHIQCHMHDTVHL